MNRGWMDGELLTRFENVISTSTTSGERSGPKLGVKYLISRPIFTKGERQITHRPRSRSGHPAMASSLTDQNRSRQNQNGSVEHGVKKYGFRSVLRIREYSWCFYTLTSHVYPANGPLMSITKRKVPTNAGRSEILDRLGCLSSDRKKIEMPIYRSIVASVVFL